MQITQIDSEPEFGTPYTPSAVYFLESDCVEYVREDAFCVYERVDDFLTLVFDETKFNLVGFKLKGFKFVFDKHLKPLFEMHDSQFIDLVSVIEAGVTKIGDQMFSEINEERRRAYKAAWKLAGNDNVKLSGIYFKAA